VRCTKSGRRRGGWWHPHAVGAPGRTRTVAKRYNRGAGRDRAAMIGRSPPAPVPEVTATLEDRPMPLLPLRAAAVGMVTLPHRSGRSCFSGLRAAAIRFPAGRSSCRAFGARQSADQRRRGGGEVPAQTVAPLLTDHPRCDPEASQASRAPAGAGPSKDKPSAIPAVLRSSSSLPPRRNRAGLRMLLWALDLRCCWLALSQERIGDKRTHNNGPHCEHASRPHRDCGAIGG
jgi:hypothetical protein